MSASKRQGIIAIGICCILVSVLLVFYGISQPKVNETSLSQLQDTLSQTSIKTSSSDKNKNSGAPWRGAEGEFWVDPYSEFVHNYNIDLAKELDSAASALETCPRS